MQGVDTPLPIHPAEGQAQGEGADGATQPVADTGRTVLNQPIAKGSEGSVGAQIPTGEAVVEPESVTTAGGPRASTARIIPLEQVSQGRKMGKVDVEIGGNDFADNCWLTPSS